MKRHVVLRQEHVLSSESSMRSIQNANVLIKANSEKAWNSYLQLPHVVSLGAMKNFVHFNAWMQDQKDQDWTDFFQENCSSYYDLERDRTNCPKAKVRWILPCNCHLYPVLATSYHQNAYRSDENLD